MKKSRIGAAAALVFALLLGGMARAQIMQDVPANALVVLKVNNLKATNDKVAKMSQDLGLAAMVPQAADPLAALLQQMKIQQGLDTGGDLAMAYLDPAATGGDPSKCIILLLPVSDYKAFLSNWPDAKTDGNITTVKIADDPEPSYVTNWDKYAAISPSKELIATKPASAITVSPIATKELGEKDVVLLANFAALKTKLLPELQKGRTSISTEIDNNARREPKLQKFLPLIKAAVNQGLNICETYLNETQAATIGVSITPEGINTTVLSEFTPDGYIGKIATSVKNSDKPLLSGLPNGKYLFFAGTQGDPQVASKVLGDILDPITKELDALGPDYKSVDDYVGLIKTYVASHTGGAFGVVEPTGQLGAEPLLQMVGVQTGEVKTLAEVYGKMPDLQQQMFKSLNVPGYQNMKVTHTMGAKTVDGVSFDSIATTVQPNAQDRMAMQQAQMMSMLYGPQGAVMFYGIVGDKMLIASGVKDDVISAAIAAAKADQAPLAETDAVKTVAAQLPKSRVAVAYINVGEMVLTGVNYARQFGMPVPLQLPPDLPPIGATIGNDGSAIRIDSHIPLKLVQSMTAAAIQMQMQMMQGGGPNGGGGL